MRLPSHLVLDFEHNTPTCNNWYQVFVTNNVLYTTLFINIKPNKKFFPRWDYTPFFLRSEQPFLIQHSNDLGKNVLRKLSLYILDWAPKVASDKSLNLRNRTNIHFLRKERLYTKLKYSRSPAFDIVSGGAAALLAGFIGFLISEKYGFELADSGDFYYLFMYGVFLSFSIKPLLTALSRDSQGFFILTPKCFMQFYLQVTRILFSFITRK